MGETQQQQRGDQDLFTHPMSELLRTTLALLAQRMPTQNVGHGRLETDSSG